MKKNNLFSTFLLIAGFLLSYFIDKIFYSINPNWATWFPENYFIRYLCILFLRLVPIAGVSFILLQKNVLKGLGLTANFSKAFFFAFLFTLPLFVGFAFFAKFDPEVKLSKIFTHCISPGFYEELLIRSFLIGLLFRYFKWGFIPASLLGALFFGSWHLYQGHDLMSSFFAFLVTAMGSVWFAWLYFEWRFNAWINISLHALMNFSWMLFSIDGGAAGNALSNIFRGITIALSIVVTVRMISLKRGFIINRKTLWINQAQT
ncbi:CPBP family intramembrane metalloprotease [Maribellus comscasis]|uniref:CPBP family intramembrane metalloprotease n=1 Tax=Maribellus comscasis TaxID=2681766 RepID=A0A6I6JXK8_9BACT|nr:CPBP family intramembrane glutamic endopeptidase [Maribellus comscasis]QGY47896.1 CPBP family intramembrane metalloprotease [Maribellus comscasis]